MSYKLRPTHLSLMCSAALLLACAETSQMQGQLAGLKDVVKKAQDNGAKYCAPRELALAESHLEFAEAELEQGFASKAQRHLWIAEPNAEAAVFLSPPEKCAYAGDRDGDGYIDSVDKCPDQPENYNGFQDGDGCPDDPDTDMDGIPDSVDQCVLDPEDKDGYLDDDGCPDPDNDKDKVLDVDDMCPNEPGPSDKEPKGCPQKAALAIVTESEIKISQQIHFEYNKAVIRQDSFPVVDAVAEILKKYSDLKMEIQGHTDNKGGPDYNKRLSDQRAAAVRTYLVEHGVASDRLTSHGYGLERPLVPNDSDNNRALNRRVQFVRTDVAKEGQ